MLKGMSKPINIFYDDADIPNRIWQELLPTMSIDDLSRKIEKYGRTPAVKMILSLIEETSDHSWLVYLACLGLSSFARIAIEQKEEL